MSGNWASIPLTSLSDEQTSFIKTVLTHKDRSHFLSGCAGSGKSVIAAHVLQILKENNPDFSCSMVVFTKLLSKFISDGFKEVDDNMMQDVGHFHQRLTRGYQQKHTDMAIIDEFQDTSSLHDVSLINVGKNAYLPLQVYYGILKKVKLLRRGI